MTYQEAALHGLSWKEKGQTLEQMLTSIYDRNESQRSKINHVIVDRLPILQDFIKFVRVQLKDMQHVMTTEVVKINQTVEIFEKRQKKIEADCNKEQLELKTELLFNQRAFMDLNNEFKNTQEHLSKRYAEEISCIRQTMENVLNADRDTLSEQLRMEKLRTEQILISEAQMRERDVNGFAEKVCKWVCGESKSCTGHIAEVLC